MTIGQRMAVRCGGMIVLLLGIWTGCMPTDSGNGMSNNNDNGSTEARWQLVLNELPAALLSVSGTSPSDVYAVGADPGDGRGPFVLRYDGTNWRRLNTSATGDLWWISEKPVNNSFYFAGEEGLILRFDTATESFERQTTPGTELIFGVWAADADTVWAVGGNFENPDAGGVIWRFDGSQWTQEDLSTIAPGGPPTLFKVWGRSKSEVYAVGFAGIILRFDGTTWSQIPSPTTRRLFTVHGNDTETVAVGGFLDSVILEQLDGAFVERAAPLTPQMNGVFIPPNGNGVVVGIEAAVAFQTTTGWEVQNTGLASQTTRDFHSVWVDPSGGIWAVGGNVISDPLNDGILAQFGVSDVGTLIVNP